MDRRRRFFPLAGLPLGGQVFISASVGLVASFLRRMPSNTARRLSFLAKRSLPALLGRRHSVRWACCLLERIALLGR